MRVDRALFDATYTQLLAALTGVLSVATDLSTSDGLLYEALRNNIYLFSAGKTAAQIKEMSSLLTAADGTIRTQAEFIRLATELHQMWNVQWLKTEYNMAMSSAQTVVFWQDLEKQRAETGITPIIVWDAVMDDRTRPDHAALDGIAKPADDPLWDKYQPPLGWGCRCTTRLTYDTQRITQRLPDNMPPPDPLFGFNPYKTRAMYSPQHPYFAYAQEAAQQLL